jgi:uncharacterized protein (TIGR00730 family)
LADTPECRVLVFCGSSESCEAKYHEIAARLGRALAADGMSVVYGGGLLGSMGALANAALEGGAQVLGIQPRFMRDLGWSHDGISALVLVDDMRERIRQMLAGSDAIVALPGGSGTLEELLVAITAKRLGELASPIVLVNQDGFFDPLLAQLERCVEERFLGERHAEMWTVVAEPEAVPPAIRATPAWPADSLSFATL